MRTLQYQLYVSYYGLVRKNLRFNLCFVQKKVDVFQKKIGKIFFFKKKSEKIFFKKKSEKFFSKKNRKNFFQKFSGHVYGIFNMVKKKKKFISTLKQLSINEIIALLRNNGFFSVSAFSQLIDQGVDGSIFFDEHIDSFETFAAFGFTLQDAIDLYEIRVSLMN